MNGTGCIFANRRIIKTRASTAVMVALLIAASASAQPVPDRDTLLLLQFDQSADADYALGTPSVDLRATMPPIPKINYDEALQRDLKSYPNR